MEISNPLLLSADFLLKRCMPQSIHILREASKGKCKLINFFCAGDQSEWEGSNAICVQIGWNFLYQ